MADSVVQYVLKIDSKSAQSDLSNVGKKAEISAHSMDDLTQSTKELEGALSAIKTGGDRSVQGLDNIARSAQKVDQAMQKVEQNTHNMSSAISNSTEKVAKLGSGFGAMASGVGAVSPELQGMFTIIADGSSLADGFGQILSNGLNPAMLAIGATVGIVTGAIYLWNQAEEEAKQKTEEMKKAIEEANKVIEEQSKIIDATEQKFAGYISAINDTNNELALLTGSMSEFELETANATKISEDFKREALSTYSEQFKAIDQTIKKRREEIAVIESQVIALAEQRKQVQSLSEKYAGQAPKMSAMTQEEKLLRDQLETQKSLLATDVSRLEETRSRVSEINKESQQLEDNLLQIAKIREEEKKRAEAEKRRAERKALQDKQEAERQKKIQEDLRIYESMLAEQDQKAQTAINAQIALQNILSTTVEKQLSPQEKILLDLQNQLARARELADISGASNLLKDVEKALIDEANRLLDEQLQKEIDLAKQAQDKVDAEKAKTEELAKQTAEKRKQDRLDKVGKGTDVLSSIASGDVSGLIGIISPIAGAISKSLIQLGQKTPEELKAEMIAQIEAIRLGLSYLPEILLSVIPQVALALTEAIIDGTLQLFKNLFTLIVDGIKNVFSLGFLDKGPDQQKPITRALQNIADFFDPSKQVTYNSPTQSFASGGRYIPRAEGGIRFTGQDQGLAMLHRGEFVVAQSGQRPQQVDRQLSQSGGGAVNVIINSAVVDRNAVDGLVRQIEQRFNSKYGLSSSNLFGGR